MFVEDLKQDFYNKLLGHRVLVLVHTDVDSVCACRVLQALFRCDNIAYSVVCIASVPDLQRAFRDHAPDIKMVVLVNCGGTLDLVDVLQPEEEVVLFVLDAHKPSNVCNVYSDGQVRLVQRDTDEDVPDFDAIFREDEDQDEEEEEDVEGEGEVRSGGEDARERRTAAALRRRERRAWLERRHTLMFNYTQFSFHGRPSACVMLELAWVLGRADTEAVWCAAVGAETAAAACSRAVARALLDTTPLLHQHAARLRNAAGLADNQQPQEGALVCVEKDAWLPLYRCWSVEGAVRHAAALAPHLRLHTLRGETRVRQLLADMGFPLQQARQAYRSMDVALRRELLAALETACHKHSLPSPARSTYLLRRPYAQPTPALDLVYILMALLEEETCSAEERLELCLAALGTTGEGGAGSEATARGAEAARRKLECVARVVNNVLAHKQLHTTGPFNYFIIQEGTSESAALGRPLWLGEAARWAAACGGRGGSARPLLACALYADDPQLCLVVGLPPKHAEEPRNLLGAAFRQALEECGCGVSQELFHAATALVPLPRRTHFLDALTKLLS